MPTVSGPMEAPSCVNAALSYRYDGWAIFQDVRIDVSSQNGDVDSGLVSGLKDSVGSKKTDRLGRL